MCRGWGAGAAEGLGAGTAERGWCVGDAAGQAVERLLQEQHPVLPQRRPLKYFWF